MAVTLGKRKRRAQLEEDNTSYQTPDAASEEDLKAAFQRAFEAKFKPLRNAPKPIANPETEEEVYDEVDEESDWEGFDSEEEVEVIQHAELSAAELEADKKRKKAFLSSKPPIDLDSTPKTKAKPTKEDNEDQTEALNLKNDLALQRLITESHLLKNDTSSDAPSGKDRAKAIDLRLQQLGAKKSILIQEKMPMSHRKGIVAKQKLKEDKRRQEAFDAGIVLEKKVRKKTMDPKRLRGVGGAGVGKARGATLSLSQDDISKIQGPKQMAGKKRGKRR